MPKFTRLTPPDFVALVNRFDWTRRVDEVHMHHTWQPNHATWKGEKSIYGMWRYHTQELGWDNIAQHVTIDPEGLIWLGRNWNKKPASNGSPNRNGTSLRGPFMFETVGNFDKGHDQLRGAQLHAVLTVIVAIQAKFNLPTGSLRFHRQLGSPKSCPGSSIDYGEMTYLVEEFKARNGGSPYTFPDRPVAPSAPLTFDDRELAGGEPWYRRMWLARRFWRG